MQLTRLRFVYIQTRVKVSVRKWIRDLYYSLALLCGLIMFSISKCFGWTSGAVPRSRRLCDAANRSDFSGAPQNCGVVKAVTMLRRMENRETQIPSHHLYYALSMKGRVVSHQHLTIVSNHSFTLLDIQPVDSSLRNTLSLHGRRPCPLMSTPASSHDEIHLISSRSRAASVAMSEFQHACII